MPKSDELKDIRQVRTYFDERMPRGPREYAAVRWESSPVRREHFRQTRLALRRELSSHRFGRVLEVGSGPLVWTPLIAERAGMIVALDLSRSMLGGAAAEDRPLAHRCCADATRLPIADDSMDALCSIRAFEYFPDKPAAVVEFARVLRPGGYLMIVTKNRDYQGYKPRAGRELKDADKRALHSANITSAALADLVRSKGFDDVVVRPVIAGRSNIPAIWMAARWLMRAIDPSWPGGLPTWLSGAVESFMVTGRRPG